MTKAKTKTKPDSLEKPVRLYRDEAILLTAMAKVRSTTGRAWLMHHGGYEAKRMDARVFVVRRYSELVKVLSRACAPVPEA